VTPASSFPARLGAALAAPLRFGRMAGSSIAAPDAAGWVSDFLNAAYFQRPPGERDPADLRLAFGVLTTRWQQLARRLRLTDVLAFHRAFGPARLRHGLRLEPDALLAGAARLNGQWFPEAWADDARRGWGIAFRTARERAEHDPGVRLRAAALGVLTPPRSPDQHWGTYPPVEVPSAGGAIAALARPDRWPEWGSALGRFTALRTGGLEGQSFEIEVVARPTAATPVFTRGYVTATQVLEPGDALEAQRAVLDHGLGEQGPCVPAGARVLLLCELTTHDGHFRAPGARG